MYSNKNIVLHELIGLKVRVLSSNDRKQKGITGEVIDETKNTLLIKTAMGIKRIVKKTSKFKFYADGKAFIVGGEEINFRPHERIEKGMKFYNKRSE